MPEENKKALCKYRIERAYECLKSAEFLIIAEDYSAEQIENARKFVETVDVYIKRIIG